MIDLHALGAAIKLAARWFEYYGSAPTDRVLERAVLAARGEQA